MLTVPHAITGAALGSFTTGVPAAPIISFGLGWASHYLLDTIPHWERIYKPHQEIVWDTKNPAQEWPRHIFIQAVLDVVIATIVVISILTLKDVGADWWKSPLLWGAIGGFFPDFIDNVPFWNRFFGNIWPFRVFQRFHGQIHISEENQRAVRPYTGLLTQIAVVAWGLWALF